MAYENQKLLVRETVWSRKYFWWVCPGFLRWSDYIQALLTTSFGNGKGGRMPSNLQRLLMSLLTKCFAAGEKDTAEAWVTDGVLNVCVPVSSLDGKGGWLAKAELRWPSLFISMWKSLQVSRAKFMSSLKLGWQFTAYILVSSLCLTGSFFVYSFSTSFWLMQAYSQVIVVKFAGALVALH